jgi:hypothetical protein
VLNGPEVAVSNHQIRQFGNIMRTIFATQDEDITCDECFEHIDQYVEMLQAGEDPATVLPQVKHHLEQCRCCEYELKALIAILEGQSDNPLERNEM